MAPRYALVSLLLALSTTLQNFVNAQATNETVPIAAPFLSRPDIDSIALNITRHNDSLISPGYIFMAPYQVAQAGPYLFDNSGNLVWTGFSISGPASSHDFRVCEWNGSDHLCMYQGNQALGYARGHGVIMDNQFQIVKSVQTGGGLPPADQHDFNTINNGSQALMTIFHPLQYDLTAYNISNGQGYIMEGVFQEVDTMTSDVLFEWRSLSHVDPSESYVLPNTTDVSGDGLTKDTPWDYFHINAVDKSIDGDYLISSRHTETIYKINSTDGSIIWQLGGKKSDFQQDFNFSYQHDVRFLSENSTTTIISFFDNAYNGFNGSAYFSEGKVVAINNSTMNATLLQAFPNPAPYGPNDTSGGLVSASQGNLQMLPNGNAFLGWGSNAFISESTADGTPIFSAYFATTGALHYRAYKFNFTSYPTDVPALYTYAQNDSAPTAFYASWNGATEVASWTYYGGSSATDMKKLGTSSKNGFETVATQAGYQNFTMVEAVASNGTGLANSSVITTFVPGAQLSAKCNSMQCPMTGSFSSATQLQNTTLDLPSAAYKVTVTQWSGLFGIFGVMVGLWI
ncbi:hypothetical protein MMC17_009193 [Xylographa soralifera]|nr:hypothetical protein [Xylographa soralifera]